MSVRHSRMHRRLWAAIRRRVIERDGYRCTRCGAAGVLEVHHKVALEDGGGAYDEDNLATLCRGCHMSVHRPVSRTAGRAEWLERLKHAAS